MNDAGRVRRLEGPERLHREVDRSRRLQRRSLALQQLTEVAALEVLHDEVRRAARQAPDVEDLHDVVAVYLRSGDAFVDEPLDGARERQDRAAHELERDRRAPQQVGRLGDRAHTAFPQEMLDPVLAVEHFTRLRIGRVRTERGLHARGCEPPGEPARVPAG